MFYVSFLFVLLNYTYLKIKENGSSATRSSEGETFYGERFRTTDTITLFFNPKRKYKKLLALECLAPIVISFWFLEYTTDSDQIIHEWNEWLISTVTKLIVSKFLELYCGVTSYISGTGNYFSVFNAYITLVSLMLYCLKFQFIFWNQHLKLLHINLNVVFINFWNVY